MRMGSAAFALLLAALLASPVFAQQRCRVMDPTGTPLNVRDAPNGAIIGQLPNGLLVRRVARATDARGRDWVYLHRLDSDEAIGWVFREFIACF
jgi:hypothetical protein